MRFTSSPALFLPVQLTNLEIAIFAWQSSLPSPSAKICFIYKDGSPQDAAEPSIGDVDKEDKLQDITKRSRCIAWARTPAKNLPVLCISESKNRFIKVINPYTGERIQTLIGHGKAINALATSPTSPHILASCSDDKNIFLWSLAKSHQKAPCVAVIGGWGHIDRILSLSWHDSGRWLLSGGFDNRVCLWHVPEHPGVTKLSAQAVHRGWTAKVLDMPYFESSEVHGHPVERVQFFGHTIISHAASEEYVQQWRIVGFNPEIEEKELPTKATFLDGEARTRSAWQFTDSSNQPMYERLLRFKVPVQEENEFGKDGKIIKKSELRDDGLLNDMWHQRRQYVDFDVHSPHQRLGEGTDHKHATLTVAKLDGVRFWDFKRVLYWTEGKERVHAGLKLELPWVEQPKPETQPPPGVVMKEEQMQRLEAAWKKKRRRKEASVAQSTSRPTLKKAAKMTARKTAPSTGGVRPDVVDSPVSVRSQNPTARKTAPSTGGVLSEAADSPFSATAHKLKSRVEVSKTASFVSDTSMQDTPTAKNNAEEEEALTAEKQENSRLRINKASETEAELLLYGDYHDYARFGMDGTGDEGPPAHTIVRPERRRSYKPAMRKSVKSTGGVCPPHPEEGEDEVEEPEIGRGARHARNLSDRESAVEDDSMEELRRRVGAAELAAIEKTEIRERKEARRQSKADLAAIGASAEADDIAESSDEEDEIPLLANLMYRYMLPKKSLPGLGGDGVDDSTLGAPPSDDERVIVIEDGLRLYSFEKYAGGENLPRSRPTTAESSVAKLPPPILPAPSSTTAIRGGDMMDKPSPPANLDGAIAKGATATATNSRKAAAVSFDWNFDLSKGRNHFAIMVDKEARAQKRKARDISQSRLDSLEFRSRGLSMTLPGRPASSAGGMAPYPFAPEEDEVDLLTIDAQQRFKFDVDRGNPNTPYPFSRQCTPNGGADNSRRKSRRLIKRQSTTKDDSSSDKIEPLHHIDMDNVEKKKFCDKCKGLLLIKDAKGKTIFAVEIVDLKTGQRQQICKFCNDKEKAMQGRKVAKKVDGNFCCLCQGVETLKWHHCLPGESRPAGGGVFCHRCWDRDYKAKRKDGGEVAGMVPIEANEASTKTGKNVCSSCKSTDSETWHSCLDGQPSATDGTLFCKQCYEKDHKGKRRASRDTKGICYLCNSTDSHVWHQRLYNKMPAGNGQILCSKCYQKDYRGKRKLGRGAAAPEEKACCVCEEAQTPQWHKRLHKGEVSPGLLYCNACWQRDKMKKEKEAAIEGASASKKRQGDLSSEKPSFENQFAEDPSSESANSSSLMESWTTSDDRALDLLLQQPNNPTANIANSLRECKLRRELDLSNNPLPSSPQKASPSRRARERRKIEEKMMENWQPKEKIAGWEKYDLGDRWRALEAHHMDTNPRDSEVPRVVRWSPCGRVVVAVGDGGVVSVYARP